MFILHAISILMEAVITALALMVGFKNKKAYGYYFGLTFFIYVLYDTTDFLRISIPTNALYVIFFVATASALLGMFKLYQEK